MKLILCRKNLHMNIHIDMKYTHFLHVSSPARRARLLQWPAMSASFLPSAPWSWRRRFQLRREPQDWNDCSSSFSSTSAKHRNTANNTSTTNELATDRRRFKKLCKNFKNTANLRRKSQFHQKPPFPHDPNNHSKALESTDRKAERMV